MGHRCGSVALHMLFKLFVGPCMSNPYQSPSGKSIQANHQSDPAELGRPRSGWFTLLAGVIGGGLLSAMVALGLAFIVLLPPMSGFFGLGGEFDGLWLMGLPVFALPCGVIGGLAFSGTWKWQRGYTIALVCASLPAATHFFTSAWEKEMSKNPRDVFVSTVVISVCMLLSAAISLKLVGTCFAAIERYRTNRLNNP